MKLSPATVILPVTVACLLASSTRSRSQEVITGEVADANTGTPVPAAVVNAVGTPRYTHPGTDGRFELTVDRLPAEIVVTHVGYEPAAIEVRSRSQLPLHIQLIPAPFEMAETVITTNDPAVRIMREVINRKQQWRASIGESWRAEVYSRQILYSHLSAIGIRESLAESNRHRLQGSREIVKAVGGSNSIPDSLRDFSSADYTPDLYGDEISLLGHAIPGPTHPLASRYYRFRLTRRDTSDGLPMAVISVRPRHPERPGFVGSIVVEEDAYEMLSVSLRVVPRVKSQAITSQGGFDFFFEQHFGSFVNGVMLPVSGRFEIEAHLGAGPLGEAVNVARQLGTPRSRLVGRTSFVHHEVDPPGWKYAYMSDLPLRRERPAATWEKRLATAALRTPPSRTEARALERVKPGSKSVLAYPAAHLLTLFRPVPVDDTPLALREDPLEEKWLLSDAFVAHQAYRLTGVPVSDLSGKRLVPRVSQELWYNRVDAAHLGLRLSGANYLDNRLALYGKFGYNTGSERFFHGAGGRTAWGTDDRVFAGALYERGTSTRTTSDNYAVAYNSVPVLLGVDDYHDYYWNERLRSEVGYRLSAGGSGRLTLGLNSEGHSSLDKNTDFDLPCDFQPESGFAYDVLCNGDGVFRPNPSVDAGDLRSIDIELSIGGSYRPFGVKAHRRLQVSVEHSGDWLSSDFSFNRATATVDWHQRTFRKHQTVPQSLDIHLVASVSTGEPPSQRFASLDASFRGFTPFGTFRTLRNRPYEGEHSAAVFWEHDFADSVFETLGWDTYGRGYGLILHGASGRTWLSSDRRAALDFAPQYSDGMHHEIGLSFKLSPLLRIDYTRRLDRSGQTVGFSIARYDLEL